MLSHTRNPEPPSDFANVLTLVPDERVARRIGESELDGRVLFLDEFASELIRHHLPELRPLTDDIERTLLREAIDELARKKRLTHFEGILETRGFFESSLNFARELRQAGIDTEQLLSRREQWGKAKLRQSLGLFVEFEQRMKGQHRVGPEERLRLAAELWRAGKREPFETVQHIEARGFIDSTSSETDFLAAVEASTLPEADWLWPSGLDHLARTLFDPNRSDVSSTSEGLHLIEASGELGEARLVAREIAGLLRQGAEAESVVVTARAIDSSVDRLMETFAEYDISVDFDGEKPIRRDPSVRALLRAFQLSDDDFPFAGTTELLRNRLFAPSWGECLRDPDLPRKSEGLLRQLGESRGRAAYLHAVRIWAESPPEGLEDEQAEESSRQRKVYLARECRGFLQRFFGAWDRFPQRAGPTEWVRRLSEFARELGFFQTGKSRGWDRWWELLDRWAARPRTGRGEGRLTRVTFGKLLQILGDTPSPSPPRRGVKILAAEQVRREPCRFLFVLGLGEGSFPRLGAGRSLIDDRDRDYLISVGLPLLPPEERLRDEQRLFRRLVESSSEKLYLAYPAIDGRGQQMLPSSFLLAVKERFAPGSIPSTHQRMLIEGYLDWEPFSEAEFRVQLAARMSESPSDDSRWSRCGLESGLVEGLLAAQRMARDRFLKERFCAHDGWLDHPLVREKLRERFAPVKPLSATALETYVYCPFRFFFEHVLRYEELDEPGEQVEQTRRGAAVHRALSRFHDELIRELDAIDFHSGVPESVEERLREALDVAVEEYVQRAPGEVAKVLWRLEGRRLQRQMSRYRGQWEKFLEPWRKEKIAPVPLQLEAGFGLVETKEMPPLVLKIGDVEVRVGGRIDRIDAVDLPAGEGKGFWIIDYKTGRSGNYTAADLRKFEKLQLPLYALAVERVLFEGKARPLGLAYWLVTEEGPKIVLPDGKSKLHDWFRQPKVWDELKERLEKWVVEVVANVRKGHFPLSPRKGKDCTLLCGFGHVCRINQSRSVGKLFDLQPPVPVSTGARE